MSAIRRRNGIILRVILAAASVAAIITGGIIGESYGTRAAAINHTASAVPSAADRTASAIATERVMTIGGSIAKGWMDTGWQNWRKGWHGGYLTRAFATLSKNTKTHYTIYDRTIVGANARQLATMYAGRYPHWLQSVRPQIVVISWGGLNDALPKTPIGIYRRDIKAEILQALAVHAVVFIVTPPVTEAGLVTYRVAEPYYLNNEMSVARSLHSPNVYTFSVFNQMKAYLAAHHLTYKPFMATTWHPNARGHKLAGEILFQDLSRRFGSQPIHFVQ